MKRYFATSIGLDDHIFMNGLSKTPKEALQEAAPEQDPNNQAVFVIYEVRLAAIESYKQRIVFEPKKLKIKRRKK